MKKDNLKSETLQKIVGKLIKRKRKEKGISQRQLSILIYGNPWSDVNISKIERGIVSTDLQTLEKILLYLDTNLNELINNFQ